MTQGWYKFEAIYLSNCRNFWPEGTLECNLITGDGMMQIFKDSLPWTMSHNNA